MPKHAIKMQFSGAKLFRLSNNLAFFPVSDERARLKLSFCEVVHSIATGSERCQKNAFTSRSRAKFGERGGKSWAQITK